MKVIILAGGLGTRLGEYTKSIPKPMVKINKYPILLYIINHYLNHGFKNIFIAAGYKSNIIKKFFKNFKKTGKEFQSKIFGKTCNLTIVDTGKKTLTGGRLKRMKNYIKQNEHFMFTYGDGVSNVNLTKLKKFHLKNKKLVTVTAVRPPARFGEIVINKKNQVISFKEKPQVKNGWINGGFFVAKKKFLDFINKDTEILEKRPLEFVAKKNQLIAFKHNGFWKCLDVRRDKEELEEIFKKKNFFNLL